MGLVASANGARHTAMCRQRMQGELAKTQQGKARIERSEERLATHLAQQVENADSTNNAEPTMPEPPTTRHRQPRTTVAPHEKQLEDTQMAYYFARKAADERASAASRLACQLV